MVISKASLRYARVSPQKARLVSDLIRGLAVSKALDILSFTNKKTASILKKLLNSALANAENKARTNLDNLKIAAVYVDDGPVLKRIHARAKGRAARIHKKMSHISIHLA
ncbi:50S ribosomal subunit protein L22 [Gammaproteobacteria bacterium]